MRPALGFPGASCQLEGRTKEEAELQSNIKLYRNIEPRARECQEIQWSLITNNGRVRIMEGGVSQLRGIITDNKHHFWGRRYSNNICWHSGLTLGLVTGIMTNRCQLPPSPSSALPALAYLSVVCIIVMSSVLRDKRTIFNRQSKEERRFIHYITITKFCTKTYHQRERKLSTIQLWSLGR